MRTRVLLFISWLILLFAVIGAIHPSLFSMRSLRAIPGAEVPWPVYVWKPVPLEADSAQGILTSRPLGAGDLHEVLVTPDFSYSDLGDRRFVAATRKGQLAWEVNLPPRVGIGLLHSQRMGEALYLTDPDRSLYVMNARDGEIYWTHFTGETVLPPTILGGALYILKQIAPDQIRIFKRSRYDGQLLWQADISLSEKPQRIEGDEREVKLVLRDQSKSLDAQTGRTLETR